MRWLAPIQIVYFVAFFSAMYALWIGENAGAIAFGIVCAAAALSFLELRCPRCGLDIRRRSATRKFVASVDALPTECPRCGRSRKGVYPFQRLLKPERA